MKEDLKLFFKELRLFLSAFLRTQFYHFDSKKGIVVGTLYRQRGKMSKRLIHVGMTSLAILGILIGPYVANEFPGRSIDPWKVNAASGSVLSAQSEDPQTLTSISSERGGIIDYVVESGDTISSIADKFDISIDTIRWQNNLGKSDTIKEGQTLQILPITGIAHKVAKGDTVESIAKRYDISPQAVVDFPFNTFANDETFDLAIGQTIIVPDGVMPQTTLFAGAAAPRARQTTPDAGTVVASGQFVWPTQGVISQGFAWYHPGDDIANRSMPPILAADAGTIVVAGWDNSGYGNMIFINHGNGFMTRYGHLSQISVVVGQTVNRGSVIGKMGSTGHSTGPHLHFEIYKNGVRVNPLSYLK